MLGAAAYATAPAFVQSSLAPRLMIILIIKNNGSMILIMIVITGNNISHNKLILYDILSYYSILISPPQ